jgi:carbamoyltransferase
MIVLGISALYHDSAAAIISDGDIISASQEERFTRVKHDPAFPAHAIRSCLEQLGCSAADVDYVAFYEKPFIKFGRLIETYLAYAPRGFQSFKLAAPIWMREKFLQKDLLLRQLRKISPALAGSERLLFAEHHQSHAASAFFPSPFETAAVLTMDGVGEWATTSIGVGAGNRLDILKQISFPHSLGLLYSAFTYHTGFKVNSGEYKLMGLAPYGKPRFANLIRERLIDINEDGSFRLDQSYFNYAVGLTMTNDRFSRLFGVPPRKPEQRLAQCHFDIAASIQAVTEEVVLKITRHLAKVTGQRNLCLAGGVALNCVANGKILRDGAFERIWIQPASGDAGGAIGAAYAVYYQALGQDRTASPASHDAMRGSYLGPEFSSQEIAARLQAAGARFDLLDGAELISRTTEALVAQKAVGWYQGRMEFGPRALGNRSILGDPRSPSMQRTLNLRVKYRESFRPFAPAVLREDVARWFDLDRDSPYMLLVADVHPDLQRKMTCEEESLFGIEKLNVLRSSIPAVTHVDYSARIQTVHRETNPRFYELLQAFKSSTGCPILVNTSFNVRGEPIVCTPEEAFRCFMGTAIEVLAIGDCFLAKGDQNRRLASSYVGKFEPD